MALASTRGAHHFSASPSQRNKYCLPTMENRNQSSTFFNVHEQLTFGGQKWTIILLKTTSFSGDSSWLCIAFQKNAEKCRRHFQGRNNDIKLLAGVQRLHTHFLYFRLRGLQQKKPYKLTFRRVQCTARFSLFRRRFPILCRITERHVHMSLALWPFFEARNGCTHRVSVLPAANNAESDKSRIVKSLRPRTAT